VDPSGELAELDERPSQLPLGGLERRRELGVPARSRSRASQAQVHGEGDQPLLRSVVQIALESPSLLVVRCDQSLARHLQFLDERGVADDEPGLRRKTLEQTLGRGGHRLLGRHLHGDRTQQRPLVAHREHRMFEGRRFVIDEPDRGRRRAGDGSGPARCGAELGTGPEPDPDLVGPDAVGHETGHLRKGIVVRRRAESLGERRDELERGRPVSVDDPVSESLGSLPGGMDDDGSRDRRGDRQQDVRTLAATDEGPGAGNHDRVHRRDEGRERAVHDRAVRHDLDAVDVMLQQRGARRERKAGGQRQDERDSQRVTDPMEAERAEGDRAEQ
jgi:hypothetical protein